MSWKDARRAILADMEARGVTRNSLVRGGLTRQAVYTPLDPNDSHVPKFDTLLAILAGMGRDLLWLAGAVCGEKPRKKPEARKALDFTRLERNLTEAAAELERVKRSAAAVAA